jgi:hypothetical protein
MNVGPQLAGRTKLSGDHDLLAADNMCKSGAKRLSLYLLIFSNSGLEFSYKIEILSPFNYNLQYIYVISTSGADLP